MDYSASEASQTPQGHKRILPKPVPSIHRRVNDPQKLCLVTEDMDRYQERQYIDIAKLNRLYDAHRLHFWSNIARSYGCNLSPATLEEAWCRSHGMSGLKFPPTPRGSPQISQASIRDFSGVPCSAVTDPSKGFMPINNGEDAKLKPMVPRQNPFAISSLLTDNKEVRQESTAGKEGYQMTVGA